MTIPSELIYRPLPVNYDDPDCFTKNWDRLIALDTKAEGLQLVVGRYITHLHADGQAVYQIVKETARKITIEVCTGIGDDWVLPAWGRRTVIDKKYALRQFEWRESYRNFRLNKAD